MSHGLPRGEPIEREKAKKSYKMLGRNDLGDLVSRFGKMSYALEEGYDSFSLPPPSWGVPALP